MMGDNYWDKYRIAPTDHPVFWRTKDGSNTLPVRLDRIKRVMDAALESGIDISGLYNQAANPRAFLEAQNAALLEDYRRWEKPVAA
jgi:hypothetical protein